LTTRSSAALESSRRGALRLRPNADRDTGAPGVDLTSVSRKGILQRTLLDAAVRWMLSSVPAWSVGSWELLAWLAFSERLRDGGAAAGSTEGGDFMSALLVGYAGVSTHDQDLTAQRDALARLGVSAERTYVDHGLTGTNRERPGLREALAACRGGDTLVVTKLDRLARSLPDAREILEDLTKREVKLSIGGSVHDPTDPVGRLLFNVLAMVAEV
jgi:hypothetical protein